MRRSLQERVTAHLAAQRVSSDILHLPVDVHVQNGFHLLEWCTKSRGVSSAVVKLEELLREGCPKCCSEHNLRNVFSSTWVTPKSRVRLAEILEGADELERLRERVEGRYQQSRWGRESTPLQEAQSAAALVVKLRTREVPAEVREERERLLRLAPSYAQQKISVVRSAGSAAQLGRNVRRWYPEGTPCLLGLPGWWRGYPKGKEVEALELLVAFSIDHPDPDLLLSRVPGWAAEFIIDSLGTRGELEMAEDVELNAEQGEVFAALWPGMPLLEAVRTAQALAG